MPIQREDWGIDPTTTGRSAPNVPAPQAAPQFSRADLELIADDEPAAPISTAKPDDGDELDAARAMLASGHLSAVEVQRLYSLSETELAAISQPKPKRPSVASVYAELQQIAKARRDDARGYYRDEVLQKRERELMALKETLADTEQKPQPRSSDDVADLDKSLVDEWRESGGVEHHLRTAQAAASAALDVLDGEEQDAFIQSFDGLPPLARTAVIRHLATGELGYTKTASAADLENFTTTPEGAELAQEWGNRATQKLGTVRARTSAILKGMGEADREAALTWFDNLPSQQAAAVLRALAK